MRRIVLSAITLLLVVAAAVPARAQTGHDLLQQALVKERAEGDLKGAIALYERIVSEFVEDRSLAASALMQLGQCWEKLGSAQAQEAYRRLVSEFADQGALAAQARTRLAALQRKAAPPANGPVARRVLSGDDTDQWNFWDMVPSPDGDRVAYVDMEHFALWIRDLASGEVQQIASGLPEAEYYSPRWSPDGKRLAVTLHDDADPAATQGGPTVIKVFDVATRQSFEVEGTRSAAWKEPAAWSPDGRSLLVTDQPSYFVTVNGGRRTPLTDSVPDAWSLSPDGRFVTFMTGDENQRLLFTQAVTGGPRHQITEKPGRVRTPLWLPDGSGVAYGADDGIWVVPLREGEVVGTGRLALSTGSVTLRAFTDAGLFYTLQEDAEVVQTGYRFPVDPATGQAAGAIEPLPGGLPRGSASFFWSPDMRRTAFAFRDDPPSVAIRSEDSSTLTRFEVPGPGSLFRTLWSADGREMLIEYMNPGVSGGPDCAVQALDLATGRMRPFLPPMHGSGGVSLSADGRRMAYWNWESFGTARRMGSISVATVGQNDGHVVATAHGGSDGPGFSGSMGGPKISPSGEQVLFARQDYADPFPKDGASLWVVGSDGKGTRKLGTLTFIRGAVWDPTSRFIAYTGRPDPGASPMVLRVVEVATGATHDVPLGDLASGDVALAGWSGDGRFLGLVASPFWEGYTARWRLEYWVVQGLEKAGS